MADTKTMHVIVHGDVLSGFTFIGPFGSLGEASQHGQDNVDSLGIHEWTVAPLKPPATSAAATGTPAAHAQE